ncbi:lipopolysaccharide/colanic/teichoic acid biosynthesis glycosyltransferase [Neobacillus niacini]|uniref:sugar transferase n=1 Tax=Neobacillus niacini TaxID=86668 RepID=UPI0028633C61|nr:sugar transferase [Neobacillus niacini]MDR7078861.1 lipopolysaccharide/colanic/teichoic acid biosynthesis glycosyltransferase [Neobacillus niacini]
MSNIPHAAEKNYVVVEKSVEIESKKKKSYKVFKRSIDIFGSFFGILLLGFVFIITALAIKLEDPKGPVFFSQRRIGLNGKEFNMYKFRSMITDAEKKLDSLLKQNEAQGAMFKMKDDPRVTKVGRFIRRKSIDELPQLFNVLKGDMSLVGPRPPLPREVKQYSNYDKQRLKVVPGCTGLWQISGRSSLGFREMVDLDLKYIKNRSILFDLNILIKTAFMLVSNKDDAY